MPSLFENLGDEPSRLTAFARNELDRRSENRSDDCLVTAFEHQEALAFAVAGGRLLFKGGEETPDPLFAYSELELLEPDREGAILLGYTREGRPRLMVPITAGLQALPGHISVVDYRSVYMQGLLQPASLGEFAQGASLVAWNESIRFCGRCGGRTAPTCGGYRRRCSACDKEYFPRTDPAVIMLAVDEENERCLLGRSPHFRAGLVSCLAGFVEPGETIEDAVRRETLEESGIILGRVKYHASQPWPFPHSLMIGCYGEAITSEITRANSELEDCRWFACADVIKMLDRAPGETYSTPSQGSIAYRLIEDWSRNFQGS